VVAHVRGLVRSQSNCSCAGITPACIRKVGSTSSGNHKTRQGSLVGLESLKIGLDRRPSVRESTGKVSRHLVEVLLGLIPTSRLAGNMRREAVLKVPESRWAG
jgi:hypothetical protein